MAMSSIENLKFMGGSKNFEGGPNTIIEFGRGSDYYGGPNTTRQDSSGEGGR